MYRIFCESVGDDYPWKFLQYVAQGIQMQYISDNHTKGSSPDKDFCHYRLTNTNIHNLNQTIQSTKYLLALSL